MENQSWKDKVKGTISYLHAHLTNLLLMCKENSKVMKITVGFLALMVVILSVVAMMETKTITPVSIVSSTEDEGEVVQEEVVVLEEALEKDAYPEINNLVKQYYQAQVTGDLDTIRGIKSSMDDREAIIITEKSKYLEAYPEISVYTKKGPEEESFVAYVQYEVKMKDYETTAPGINTLYICKNSQGNYFINEDVTQETLDYIKVVTAHNDVIDLYNTVQVQYNEVVTEDEALGAFLTALPEELKTSVSLSLAKKEEENAPKEEPDVPKEPEVVVTKVKTTSVVNVRSSDSIEADRIGKTTQGQVLELVEQRVNGWSKIIFDGKEGFIKTEFLEPEETITVGAEEEEMPMETADPPAPPAPERTPGKVTDTVNVRETPSTEGNKLGKLTVGSEVQIIEKQSDGWTKILYNDKEAYIKSDYVE